MSLHIVIIEDEPAIARNLSYLINEIENDANVLVRLENIKESVKWFNNNNNYDLILSDIRLSDGLSFEIFQQVKINVPVIFITAYDEYALDAFRANGIDYILKPFDENNLKTALNKFKSFGSKNIFSQDDILKLLKNIKSVTPPHKQSLLVHYRDKLLPVNINDVQFFYSKNEIVHAYLQSIQYIIDGTLEKLEQQLNPLQFFRANRQFIVNRKALSEVHFYFNGRLFLKISPEPPEKILISKARAPEFKEWMNK